MHKLGKGCPTIPNCWMSQWVLLFNYQADQTTELPALKKKKDVPVRTRMAHVRETAEEPTITLKKLQSSAAENRVKVHQSSISNALTLACMGGWHKRGHYSKEPCESTSGVCQKA